MSSLLKNSIKQFKKIGLGLAVLAVTQSAYCDWTVQGSQIIDPNGTPFVYRGVNLGILPDDASLPFVMSDIAYSGANAVRIPVQGMGNDRLTRYVEQCKQNRLVCVLTDTSIYGYGDNFGPSNQSDILYAWLSRKPVLDAYKDYVIVDIASGPSGNGGNLIMQFYEFIVVLLRLQGVTNQLMISGSNWGQDWSNELRDNAEYIRSKDSLNNVIFSVHMYEAYSDPATIRSYLKSYLDRGLPIVVSEFGPVRRDRNTNESRNPYVNNTVAVDSIMATTQELGVGYLGWTWSGYTTKFTDLNMFTAFDPNKITPWGTRLIDGENGIKATAKRASHFSAGSASSRSSSSVSSENLPPYAVITGRVVNPACGSAFAEMSGADSKDPNNDPLTYSWQVYDSSLYSYQNFTGRDLNFPIRSNVVYQFILDVEDGRGGRSTATKDMSLNFPSACPPPPSSSSSMRSSSSRSFSSSSSSFSSRSSVSSRPSSSSVSSRSSSSAGATKAQCSYVINSQWSNGFTASIRIKNTSNTAINGWDVNWQYADGSKVTNLWNATLRGSNPYSAKNLNWNSTIQPGQTVEFGFQGSKSSAAAAVPAVTGAVCQ